MARFNMYPETPPSWLSAIDASRDGQSIWITRGDGKLLVSVNAGITWEVIEICDVSLLDIRFQDRRNGWACGQNGKLLMTTDGGNIWSNCDHPFGSQDLISLALVPGQRVYVASENGVAMSTEVSEIENDIE